MNKLPLRPNACLLIFKGDKLLLCERLGDDGHWQLPQGGIDDLDDIENCVMRELEEEVGLTGNNAKIIKKLDSIHEYEWDSPPRHMRDKYRGQSQTFWLIEMTGPDEDIKLDTHHVQEFQNWRWVSVDEIKKMAFPIRVTGYESPLAEFAEYLESKAS